MSEQEFSATLRLVRARRSIDAEIDRYRRMTELSEAAGLNPEIPRAVLLGLSKARIEINTVEENREVERVRREMFG